MIETPFQGLIEKILAREKPSEVKLYKFLYEQCEDHFKGLNLDLQEYDEVFQDSFLILFSQLGRMGSRGSHLSLQEGLQFLQKRMRKIFEEQLFDMDRSVAWLVKGVQLQNEVATRQLVEELKAEKWQRYATKLTKDFHLLSWEPEDVIAECSFLILKKIRAGSYIVEKHHDNVHHKNALLKYYRMTMYNTCSKRGQRKTSELPLNEQLAENAPVERPREFEVEELSILTELRKLIGQLDHAGQRILKELYFFERKPRQIAKLMKVEAYDSTEKVQSKKKDCLQKLKREVARLVQRLGDTARLEFIQLISRLVQELAEPCRTILYLFLPPNSLSYELIAKELQRLPISSAATDLRTADQIKKRKFRCMQGLNEALWKQAVGMKN